MTILTATIRLRGAAIRPAPTSYSSLNIGVVSLLAESPEAFDALADAARAAADRWRGAIPVAPVPAPPVEVSA